MPTRAMVKSANERMVVALQEGNAEGVVAALDNGAAVDHRDTAQITLPR
jgi:hypothetical protein